ncbi:hypothetical protein CSKR_105910 [Clonorchis sinensis]|uniref:Fibronectin type-III domain-containing protein n=1 Tax=Clonorchis sinensis TaxID=79923 RepID=A0A3R7DPG8_CLOSI|nr:hypothetical protein CSKR_105910 [Clonorchis sinensis]
MLSWTYDNPCPAALYEIAVYRSAGGSILLANSTNKNVLLRGLPKCVGMYVEVLAKDSLGRGPLTQTGEFIIPADYTNLDSRYSSKTNGPLGLQRYKPDEQTGSQLRQSHVHQVGHKWPDDLKAKWVKW